MPRALRFYVSDLPSNSVSNLDWAEISSLQHWYNSEFFWSCDRIDFKRYILFPNYDHIPDMPYRTARYHFRRRLLKRKIEVGNWVEAVEQLVAEGLFHVRWGGSREGSIASGVTHVADNEYNAYLLSEFLLKASTLCTTATFVVEDEGKFVLPGRAAFRNGVVQVYREDLLDAGHDIQLLDPPQVFAVVDPSKYDDHPPFSQNVGDVAELDEEELASAIGFQTSLGFGEHYDTSWGDHDGLNLLSRATKTELI